LAAGPVMRTCRAGATSAAAVNRGPCCCGARKAMLPCRAVGLLPGRSYRPGWRRAAWWRVPTAGNSTSNQRKAQGVPSAAEGQGSAANSEPPQPPHTPSHLGDGPIQLHQLQAAAAGTHQIRPAGGDAAAGSAPAAVWVRWSEQQHSVQGCDAALHPSPPPSAGPGWRRPSLRRPYVAGAGNLPCGLTPARCVSSAASPARRSAGREASTVLLSEPLTPTLSPNTPPHPQPAHLISSSTVSMLASVSSSPLFSSCTCSTSMMSCSEGGGGGGGTQQEGWAGGGGGGKRAHSSMGGHGGREGEGHSAAMVGMGERGRRQAGKAGTPAPSVARSGCPPARPPAPRPHRDALHEAALDAHGHGGE
jgi:hypothetical protein